MNGPINHEAHASNNDQTSNSNEAPSVSSATGESPSPTTASASPDKSTSTELSKARLEKRAQALTRTKERSSMPGPANRADKLETVQKAKHRLSGSSLITRTSSTPAIRKLSTARPSTSATSSPFGSPTSTHTSVHSKGVVTPPRTRPQTASNIPTRKISHTPTPSIMTRAESDTTLHGTKRTPHSTPNRKSATSSSPSADFTSPKTQNLFTDDAVSPVNLQPAPNAVSL